jgi:hypothetical protein
MNLVNMTGFNGGKASGSFAFTISKETYSGSSVRGGD